MDTYFYISFFFNLLFLYIIYNVYTNLVTIENTMKIVLNDKFKFYNFILTLLIKCYAELEQIDKKGSFSSDDEVGFAFGIIKTSIQTTMDEMKKLNEEDGTEEN